MDSIYEKLITIIDESKIKTDEDMSKHTSFKTGGKTRFLVKASSIEEIKNVIKITKENNISLFILGNGSNILFKDSIFEGIVLKIELNNIKIENERVILEAGVKNAVAARKLLDKE